MTFELLCMGLIALLFGTIMVFAGYRLFVVLIPIWGFFAGFAIGAQTIHFLLGDEFLGTVTGWVVGFFVALLFAGLSYLFYVAAVALLSGSLGYGLTIALLAAIGMDGFLAWLIGITVAVIFAVVVLRFNIQKYVIIIATAIGGTGAIIFTFLAMSAQYPLLELAGDPVRRAIDDSFLWLLLFLVVAGMGIVAQIQANRNWEVETYNRYADMEAGNV